MGNIKRNERMKFKFRGFCWRSASPSVNFPHFKEIEDLSLMDILLKVISYTASFLDYYTIFGFVLPRNMLLKLTHYENVNTCKGCIHKKETKPNFHIMYYVQ